MSERTGVGLVEIATLEAADLLGARLGRAYVKSSRVLDAVEESIGLAPGYGYEVMVDLAQPWKVPIPLLDPHGNFGSRGNDPPANPPYTEVRLSPAGQAVLAAERGELAPVPMGLINGNTYRQGSRPPFRPQGVIDAIRRVLDKRSVTSEEIADIIGPPDFMTGCTITGDLAGLRAGRPAELRLLATVTVTDEAAISERSRFASQRPRTERNRTVLVIDHLPPMVNPDETVQTIASRTYKPHWEGRHPGLQSAARLQVQDIRDESDSPSSTWLVCLPDADADPIQVREQLLNIYGVSATVQVRLPRPLATMIRQWAAAHRGEDIGASLTALESAIAATDSYQDR